MTNIILGFMIAWVIVFSGLIVLQFILDYRKRYAEETIALMKEMSRAEQDVLEDNLPKGDFNWKKIKTIRKEIDWIISFRS